uniref:Uncharacterized protein n=1 Tax=Rhizophora mucronata TaxID=61149 RepID=A0A2P2J2U1_RHIMU
MFILMHLTHIHIKMARHLSVHSKISTIQILNSRNWKLSSTNQLFPSISE